MTDAQRTSAPEGFRAPWMNLWQGPQLWSAFGTCAQAAEPMARSAARAQLELTSLVGIRARAWASIPETMSRCRTPLDLFQAQFAFWQEAGRNYVDASQRMMAAWRSMLPGAFGEALAEHVVPRDYITFPEPKQDEASEERRRPGEGRRAA
jgi:hypothetical protein